MNRAVVTVAAILALLSGSADAAGTIRVLAAGSLTGVFECTAEEDA